MPPRTASPLAPVDSLRGRDLLTLSSMSTADILSLFDLAAKLKRLRGAAGEPLRGRSVILLFEKPSLRTRVTFEAGAARLGAHVIYFDQSKQRLGERESIRDYGRNLERWVDCVVARVFSHAALEELARECDVPVINALSDWYHPCQALADYFTLFERYGEDGLRGFPLAYVGDGNNVCHSLIHGAAKLGAHLTIVCPPGHEPGPDVLAHSHPEAVANGATIRVTHDLGGVSGARAVYTDAWASMGQESEAAARRRTFASYQVNDALMAKAAPGALFMHCLPAHRGEEVTDPVIDAPTSVVYDQAENRMHVQDALLVSVLSGG